jgi:alpha-glucosidase
MWHFTSPDNSVAISVSLNGQGALSMVADKFGNPAAQIKLGLLSNLCDFTGGLEYEREETNSIAETYSIPAGKKAVYENKANELALYFKKNAVQPGNSCPLIVRFRAYDEGVAFRYEIPMDGEPILIHNETTDFQFSKDFDRLWLQDWVASYEAPYNRAEWGAAHDGRRYGMPALLRSSQRGLWVMINEANVLNLNGAYCISHLQGTPDRTLKLAFAPEERGGAIKSPLPFCSPWRYLLITDNLNDVITATLNYNLNPPPVIRDTSWIKPARALWAWWASDMGAQIFTEAAQYVDFAAAMGFEAVLMDAGWDYTWIKEFCDYARANGVSPWLWSAMQYIDTEEKARKYLPLWKSFGIDGVKIDFFENDSAYTASRYNMMADIMAEQKLMVNFHGAAKPMGEGRTWPHFITAEGVMGLEHYKWSGMPNAEHNCTLPFIRNAAGPMDYTPTGFSNKNRNTTMAHQMALAAVFESGSQHYAASIYQLEAWEGTGFLRRLKPKYDGVKLLAGYPGDYAAILRWVEKPGEWVIGCITNASRELHISLDFLPEGEFEAEIFGDTRMGYEITYEKRAVNKNSRVGLTMPEHGGAGIYIAEKIKPLASGADRGYLCDKRVTIPAEEMRLLQGSERLDFETKAAVLLNGGAAFTIDGLPASKRYTVRCFYSAETPCELELFDGKTVGRLYLPGNAARYVYATAETGMALGKGSCRMTARRVTGEAPIIAKIAVIDNDPPDTLALNAYDAAVSGGAELVQCPEGLRAAAGLGLGGELIFDPVIINADGRYIIRLNYLAGVSGEAQVSINNGEPIPANLAGLGGWSATQRGERLAREILAPLKKGRNTLRIFNAAAPLPFIYSLCVTPFEV